MCYFIVLYSTWRVPYGQWVSRGRIVGRGSKSIKKLPCERLNLEFFFFFGSTTTFILQLSSCLQQAYQPHKQILTKLAR